MKNFATFLALTLLCGANLTAAPTNTAAPAPKSPTIRLVDFKTCIEQSKLGKKEQENFDALKNQMEKVVLEKQKEINDIADKLSDADYVDSLSPEAETELKRKLRSMSQEFAQMREQYIQMLQQANMKVLQKISDSITKSSDIVAKNNQFDLILNAETAPFSNPSLNVSNLIVVEMDKIYEEEEKKSAAAPQLPPNTLPTPNSPAR